jgi:hypothetical protein
VVVWSTVLQSKECIAAFHPTTLRHLVLSASHVVSFAERTDDKRPSTPDPRIMATHGDTGLFFGAPDVDAVSAHLRAKGIDLKEPNVAPYGMKVSSPV